jgi:hypothetical protein
MNHPLTLVDGKANLVFHDVSATARSRYTVPLDYVVATVEQLRLVGLSRHVRLYFDDGYASARPTAQLLRQRYPEIEIVAALTITAVGKTGYLNWTDVEALCSWGVYIAGHGHQHVRLAAYVDGVAVDTPSDGGYQDAPDVTGDQRLSANEVLFQLTETRDALRRIGRSEFVLPYGAYNSEVVTINERHHLFTILSTADYGWDLGQQLRPRLLMTQNLSPREIPAFLTSPWVDHAAG